MEVQKEVGSGRRRRRGKESTAWLRKEDGDGGDGGEHEEEDTNGDVIGVEAEEGEQEEDAEGDDLSDTHSEYELGNEVHWWSPEEMMAWARSLASDAAHMREDYWPRARVI